MACLNIVIYVVIPANAAPGNAEVRYTLRESSTWSRKPVTTIRSGLPGASPKVAQSGPASAVRVVSAYLRLVRLWPPALAVPVPGESAVPHGGGARLSCAPDRRLAPDKGWFTGQRLPKNHVFSYAKVRNRGLANRTIAQNYRGQLTQWVVGPNLALKHHRAQPYRETGSQSPKNS